MYILISVQVSIVLKVAHMIRTQALTGTAYYPNSGHYVLLQALRGGSGPRSSLGFFGGEVLTGGSGCEGRE